MCDLPMMYGRDVLSRLPLSKRAALISLGTVLAVIVGLTMIAAASAATPEVCAGNCPPVTTPLGADTVSIRLAGSANKVTFNDALDISGTLMVCADGTSPSPDENGNPICDDGLVPSPNIPALDGQTVELQQAAWPYTNFVTVSRTTTDSSGFYDFSLKAGFTGRYRVVISALSMTSSVTSTLFVYPLFTVPGLVNWNSGIFKVHFTVQVPASVKLGGLRVVWYVHSRSHKRWYRVGFSRLKSLGPGKASAKLKSKLPRVVSPSDYNYWKNCFSLPQGTSVGNPAISNKCPSAKSISNHAI